MIRAALIILALVVVVAAVFALAGDPGTASLVWLGWRLDTSAAAAVVTIGVLSFIAVAFWKIAAWISDQPRRSARARAASRRKQADEMLTRGFLAVAAGEGAEARRCAQKAADLADENPTMARVLAAQAAEAVGDWTAAQAAWSAMLAFPDMRLAAHRGLMGVALAQGEQETALRHAQDAYNMARTARWAWRALFEAKLEAGEWSEALDLVEGALKRKIVTPAVAERARAALLAASAASLETSADRKSVEQAADYAVRAAKLDPAFSPAAVIAGRLLGAAGKPAKAEEVIRAAWSAQPHPALWMTYRDLRMDETPKARAARLQALVDAAPERRESRILRLEQALIAGDVAAARAATSVLAEEPPTARLCGLLARAAWAAGQVDEARAWVARGAVAAQEPDWSDVDPEGRAFAYGQADWTRLVSTWAETGELIHPRFERRERVLSDLPELPSGYEASRPFVAAAERGLAPPSAPDDPGDFDDALAGPDDEPRPAPARRTRRRRGGGLGKAERSV